MSTDQSSKHIENHTKDANASTAETKAAGPSIGGLIAAAVPALYGIVTLVIIIIEPSQDHALILEFNALWFIGIAVIMSVWSFKPPMGWKKGLATWFGSLLCGGAFVIIGMGTVLEKLNAGGVMAAAIFAVPGFSLLRYGFKPFASPKLYSSSDSKKDKEAIEKKPDFTETENDIKAEEAQQTTLQDERLQDLKAKESVGSESEVIPTQESNIDEAVSITLTKGSFKRKLTAILSADAVDYSRLMESDEEITVRTLIAYKEVIATLILQHNGKVVDSPGDNLLAEFVSVVDAVQCAVSIQKELESRNAELPVNHKMLFRIGINLGDVIQEKDRIFGDGVNIAARLEGLADPGGICVSKTAFDHIESKLPFGYEYLGNQTVKNIAKPIGAYRVLMQPRVTVSGTDKQKKVYRSKNTLVALSAVLALFIIGGYTVWKIYFKTASPQDKVSSVDKKVKALPMKPISEKAEIKSAAKFKQVTPQNVNVASNVPKKTEKKPAHKFADETTEKKTDSHIKSTEPTDELSKLIQKSKHKEIYARIDAIEELSKISDPRAIEALVLALGDESERIKVQASMKLWDIGKPAVKPLIEALQDPLSKSHCKAAQTLGLIKDPRAITTLFAALSSDKDIRWCVEEALAGMGKPAVELLTRGLNSIKPNQKASSARILAEMYPPVEEPLIEALQNGDIIIIGAAYKFYIQKGIKDSEPLLIEALNTAGHKSMAEAYANSGNIQLRKAAIQWAESHGYRVSNFPGSVGAGKIKWGKFQ